MNYTDGVSQVDSISSFLGQACRLPWSHAAAGRETRCSSSYHQFHEEVRKSPTMVGEEGMSFFLSSSSSSDMHHQVQYVIGLALCALGR